MPYRTYTQDDIDGIYGSVCLFDATMLSICCIVVSRQP